MVAPQSIETKDPMPAKTITESALHDVGGSALNGVEGAPGKQLAKHTSPTAEHDKPKEDLEVAAQVELEETQVGETEGQVSVPKQEPAEEHKGENMGTEAMEQDDVPLGEGGSKQIRQHRRAKAL